MEGDEGRQGSSPHNLSLKRRPPDGGPISAAGTGEVLERRIRQRSANPDRENLISAAPIAPEDITRNPGRIVIIPDTALGGDVPQVDDPWIRSSLISEGPRALVVIWYDYQPEDEMRLDINNMSYEGSVRKLIMAKMEKWKYSCSTTGHSVDAETCCICLEEYADDDDVGKLDCGMSIMLPASRMVGTEELMPHLQEYCLGYLRV
ncbi:hypothetical protein CK203_078423 [Vitis vinifera]|uniref:RING-type E3 ubiquitin transferase n=1 Tax=Vitis vinifera TaxID=29760 RepID=A0A438F5X3_VITVI|nr:hypothetical protein CK203_078423 [Vitis vinifera]